MMKCAALTLPVLTLLCLLIAACGVKPSQVDPPDGKPSQFPRSYPNPAEP